MGDVVGERNSLLKEHLNVVLNEKDVVLYRNSAFTSTLTTEEDSLRSERRRYILELEQTLVAKEVDVLRQKVIAHFPDGKAAGPLNPNSLLALLFRGFCGWTFGQFASLYGRNLHDFVHRVFQQASGGAGGGTDSIVDAPLENFVPTLLRDTSSVDDLGSAFLLGNPSSSSDNSASSGETVQKALFLDETSANASWSQNTLVLCLGLIMYRVLAQTRAKSAQEAVRNDVGVFRKLFFELSDPIASFFSNLWILDTFSDSDVSASDPDSAGGGLPVAGRLQQARDELHTLHLKGALRPYFSSQQLKRVFDVTRGPYVSNTPQH
eukprot:INCI12725.1.p1 GENE.INCI12725.1~~INCI12725.1.p1  ORF type:complete len:369 (-),score=44.60 INCI12725.1:329-1294(-)